MSTFKTVTQPTEANPVRGDLELDETGNFIFLSDDVEADAVEAIAQHIRERCLHIYGEWFLDEREGFPYFEEVFKKNPDLEILKALFRSTILGTPGVSTLNNLEITTDPVTREATLKITALSDRDLVVRVGYGAPFIVRP